MRFMTVINISSFFLKFIPRSQDRAMTLKKTANNVKWKQVKIYEFFIAKQFTSYG